jgi:hypothetical protein
MPPTDYAVMPGTEDVTYSRRELDAELVLAPIAGKLMMFSRAVMPVIELALLAAYVYTGVWARSHRDLPGPAQHPQEPSLQLSNVLALKRHGPRNSRL